jgi:DNA-binding GntR family transcriptional regulator
LSVCRSDLRGLHVPVVAEAGPHQGGDRVAHPPVTHAPRRAVESVAEHEALLDLLEAHADPDTIETAARQHKLNTLEAVTRHAETSGKALA